MYGDIPEKPSLTDVFSIMVSFNLPAAAGILALLLSYDAISREREEGTIELLLSYPVYRDEVINGKFAAGLFTVSIALLIAFIASSGLAIFMTGLIPTLQQVYRLMFLWQGSVVYMAFFFGLGTFFSTLFRSSWRSLIAGMIVLLIFLATPLIASIAANYVYPVDRGPGGVVYSSDMPDDKVSERQKQLQKQENFKEQVSKFSPTSSYRSFVNLMLGNNYQSSSGLEPSIWESLKSAIGYLIFLLSETMLMFAASYTVFMRQDL